MGFTNHLVIESKVFSLLREGGSLHITEKGRKVMKEHWLGWPTVSWFAHGLEACRKGDKCEVYATTKEEVTTS